MTASFVIAVDCRALMNPCISGVSVYTREMIRELTGQAELLLFYQNGKRIDHLHKEFPEIQFHQISSTFFHLKSLFSPPSLPFKYFRINPDVIWLPDRRPFYNTDIPLVMSIHDDVPKRSKPSLSLKTRIWHFLFSTSKLLKNVDGVLCPSFTVEQELPRTLARRVTYEGVRPVKSGNFIKYKNFTLFIAPNDPRKRVHWLIRLAKDFPKEHFIWMGGEETDPRFAKSNLPLPPNIKRLFDVSEEDKWALLRKAKGLLALSEYEGFDLPVLEAVEAKCPVILSNISVHRELYTNAAFVNSYEELKTEFLRQNWKLPKKRGIYTWSHAAREALLFFRRIVEDKNR